MVVVAAEWWHYRGTDIYKLKDSLASMTLGLSYLILEVLFYALFVWSIFDWIYQFRLMTIEIKPLSFLLLYLAVDVLFYVYHRTAHQIRWFWASHCVHHASEHLNFTTAMRQSALYPDCTATKAAKSAAAKATVGVGGRCSAKEAAADTTRKAVGIEEKGPVEKRRHDDDDGVATKAAKSVLKD